MESICSGRAFWIIIMYIYCVFIYNIECVQYTGMPPLTWGPCSVEGIFMGLPEIDTHLHCMDECKGRELCSGVNYWRMTRVCELLKAGGDGSAENKICFYISREEMEESAEERARCSNCNDPKFCDVGSGSCTFKECPKIGLVDADAGKVYGNVYTFGKKAVVFCNDGFLINGNRSESFTCLDAGDWSGSQQIECVSQ